jgi:multidrug resistance efflux pump
MLFTLLFPLSTLSQEAKPEIKPVEKGSAEKAKTVSLTLGNIQSEVNFNVSFSPREATEVSVELKSLPSIKVEEAVAHGAPVKAGEQLVRLATDSLKEQIEAQELAVASLRIIVEESEREAKIAELQVPLDREQAEITRRQADEDYKYFLEIDKGFSEKINEQRLKSSKDFLDYSEEELKQLEKMYKADDLTEESEEIVLRRAKDDFERQKFSFEQAEANFKKSKELLLPRATRDRHNAHRLAEIAWQRFQLTQPVTAEKRVQSMAKAKLELQKGAKLLENLRNDLKACDVKSPRDGVVYYGRVQSGKWVGGTELRSKLRKHGTINAHEVIMTVVDPNNQTWIGSVGEVDLPKVRIGASGRVTPTAMKSERLDVSVRSVAPVPSSEGQFEVMLDVRKGKDYKDLVAGMTGSAKVISYFNARAATLPVSVVHTDEFDDLLRYVYVLVDGKPSRKSVEVGVTQGDRIEIRSGLSGADEVLVEKPKSE